MIVEMGKKYCNVYKEPVVILTTTRDYPEFPVLGLVNNRDIRYYDNNGKAMYDSHEQDLIIVSKYDDFKIDDQVLVSNHTGNVLKRHFAGISKNGKPLAYQKGWTSWTASGYQNTHEWDSCIKYGKA